MLNFMPIVYIRSYVKKTMLSELDQQRYFIIMTRWKKCFNCTNNFQELYTEENTNFIYNRKSINLTDTIYNQQI